MPDWQNPWSHGDYNSGTLNQENFTSKPLGQNLPASKLATNNPRPTRQFGKKYRMGNKRKLAGG